LYHKPTGRQCLFLNLLSKKKDVPAVFQEKNRGRLEGFRREKRPARRGEGKGYKAKKGVAALAHLFIEEAHLH